MARELGGEVPWLLERWGPFEHLERPRPAVPRPAASISREERIRIRMWRWALRAPIPPDSIPSSTLLATLAPVEG